jgi:IS30 family transposase
MRRNRSEPSVLFFLPARSGRLREGKWLIRALTLPEAQEQDRPCWGKLPARTAAETNRALLGLLARHPGRLRTITADNGTEFHWYGRVEAVSPVKFYFATPHHSWERGTNENTNGLIRQVSAQRSKHGPSYPKRVRLNRRTPQQSTKKKT